ncbi:hypothetical protein [Oryzobacter telluris]|uniref:hypothetical protein n=1 Tax=Oryzobacter telluris TaxID=3149179 RepID=UPI00370DD594
MTAARFVAAEAAHHELPMPPWLFGVIALVAFAFLLAVTWSFRGTAQKHARPVDGRHGTQDVHGQREDAHWPEHPGHQH